MCKISVNDEVDRTRGNDWNGKAEEWVQNKMMNDENWGKS